MASSRLRLFIKWLFYPGANWPSRDKARLVKWFRTGSPGRPLKTLDCGCGNAYFTLAAYRRGSTCLGVTIHEWEQQHCEEMRDYLGVPASAVSFRTCRLEALAEMLGGAQFDQVLLLDVLEHIMDDRRALRQLHALLKPNGFLYVSTPARDGKLGLGRLRVSAAEDGWHVRHGYTFEQLEALLEETGFEPIDRQAFGTSGSTAVIWIQDHIFRSASLWLTLAAYPLLKLLALALAFRKDPHTILVLARKRARAGAA